MSGTERRDHFHPTWCMGKTFTMKQFNKIVVVHMSDFVWMMTTRENCMVMFVNVMHNATAKLVHDHQQADTCICGTHGAYVQLTFPAPPFKLLRTLSKVKWTINLLGPTSTWINWSGWQMQWLFKLKSASKYKRCSVPNLFTPAL